MFVCKIWYHFILLYYAHLLDAVRINEILMWFLKKDVLLDVYI